MRVRVTIEMEASEISDIGALEEEVQEILIENWKPGMLIDRWKIEKIDVLLDEQPN